MRPVSALVAVLMVVFMLNEGYADEDCKACTINADCGDRYACDKDGCCEEKKSKGRDKSSNKDSTVTSPTAGRGKRRRPGPCTEPTCSMDLPCKGNTSLCDFRNKCCVRHDELNACIDVTAIVGAIAGDTTCAGKMISAITVTSGKLDADKFCSEFSTGLQCAARAMRNDDEQSSQICAALMYKTLKTNSSMLFDRVEQLLAFISPGTKIPSEVVTYVTNPECRPPLPSRPPPPGTTPKTCQTLCTEQYDPVCAEVRKAEKVTKQTFSNDCFLDMAKCEGLEVIKVTRGECDDDNSSEESTTDGNGGDKGGESNKSDTCPKSCPSSIVKVCATITYTNGRSLNRTYDNECVMRSTTCNKKRIVSYTFINGSCVTDGSSEPKPTVPPEVAACRDMGQIGRALQACAGDKIRSLASSTLYSTRFCQTMKVILNCTARKILSSTNSGFKTIECVNILTKYMKNIKDLPKQLKEFQLDRCQVKEVACGGGLRPLDDFDCSKKRCPANYDCKHGFCCPKVTKGVCPKKKNGLKVCTKNADDICTDDAGCRNGEKCCNVGCKEKRCIEPETKVKSKCDIEFENAKKLLQQKGSCSDLKSPVRVPKCKNGEYLPTQGKAGTDTKYCVTKDGDTIVGSEHTDDMDCTNVHAGICPSRPTAGKCTKDNTVPTCTDDASCTASQKCCLQERSGVCEKKCLTALNESSDANDCPNPMCCPVTMCQYRYCPTEKDAECRINNCGSCSVEFFVGDDKVEDCFAGMSTCEKKRAEAMLRNAKLGKSDTEVLDDFIETKTPEEKEQNVTYTYEGDDDEDDDESISIGDTESLDDIEARLGEHDDDDDDDNDDDSDDDTTGGSPTNTRTNGMTDMTPQVVCSGIEKMCQNGGTCALGVSMEPFKLCTCPSGYSGLFCEIASPPVSKCDDTNARMGTFKRAMRTKPLLQTIYKMTVHMMQPLPDTFQCDDLGDYNSVQSKRVKDGMALYFCVSTSTGIRSPYTDMSNNADIDCSTMTLVELKGISTKCSSKQPESCDDGDKCQYFFNPFTQMCDKGKADGNGFHSLSQCYDACGHGVAHCDSGDCPKAVPKPCESLDCIYEEQYCRVEVDDNLIQAGECTDFQGYCLLNKMEGTKTMDVRPTVAFYFNSSTRTCAPFRYYGSGGNNNRFKTRHQCQTECGIRDYRNTDISCPDPKYVQGDDLRSNECEADSDCPVENNVCCSSGRAKRCVRRVQVCTSGQKCSILGTCTLGGVCLCDECDGTAVNKVCGSDGKTYDNECQLNYVACRSMSSVTVVSQGECTATSPSPDPCNDVCPDIYEPVCGIEIRNPGNLGSSTYVTRYFSNMCELTREAKCYKDTTKEVKFIYPGTCQSPITCGGRTCNSYHLSCDKITNECSCDKPCTKDYRPVCAHPWDNNEGAMSFSNICVMKVSACQKETIYSVSKIDGKCKEPEFKCPATPVDVKFTMFECNLRTNERCGRGEHCCRYGTGSKCFSKSDTEHKDVAKPGICPSPSIVSMATEDDSDACLKAECKMDSDCEGTAKCCGSQKCGNRPICFEPLVCDAGYKPLPLTCDPSMASSSNQCLKSSVCKANNIVIGETTETTGVCCHSDAVRLNKTELSAAVFCQKMKDNGVTCQNGGTCIGDIKSFTICKCQTGFSGAFCQYTPPTESCPPENIFNCFVPSCQFSNCPAYPTATCTENYCGGCHAIFKMGEEDVTSRCNPDALTLCQKGQKFTTELGQIMMNAGDSEDHTMESRRKRDTDDPPVPSLINEVEDESGSSSWMNAFAGSPGDFGINLPWVTMCAEDGSFPDKMCFRGTKRYCTCVDEKGMPIAMAPRTRTVEELDCSVVKSDFPRICLGIPEMNVNECGDGTQERYFFNKTSGTCTKFMSCNVKELNSFPDSETCLSKCTSGTHVINKCATIRCGFGLECRLEGGKYICADPETKRSSKLLNKGYEPVCEDDGSFAKKQCQGRMCACVDVSTGGITAGPFFEVPSLDCDDPTTFPPEDGDSCEPADDRPNPKFCEEGGDPCANNCGARSGGSGSSGSNRPDNKQICTNCQTCDRNQKCPSLDCSNPDCPGLPEAVCTVNTCTCKLEYKANNKIIDCNKKFSTCVKMKAAVENKNKGAEMRKLKKKVELKCSKGVFEAQCNTTDSSSSCQCLNAATGEPYGQIQNGVTIDTVNCARALRVTRPKTVGVDIVLAKTGKFTDLNPAGKEKFKKYGTKLLEKVATRTGLIAESFKLVDGSIVLKAELQDGNESDDVDVVSHTNEIVQQINNGEMSVDVDGEMFTPSGAEITQIVYEENDEYEEEGGNGKTIVIIVVVIAVVVLLVVIGTAVFCIQKSKTRNKARDIPFSEIEGKSNPTYVK